MKADTGNLNPEGVHEEFDDWAALAITDGLSESEKIVFAAHLATCPTCAALYQKTQLMNQTLTDAFTREGPSSGFENQLVRAFREKGERSWFTKIPTTIAWLLSLRGVQTAGIVAAMTLLVAVGSKLSNATFQELAGRPQVAVNTRGNSGKERAESNKPIARAARTPAPAEAENEPSPRGANDTELGPQPALVSASEASAASGAILGGEENKSAQDYASPSSSVLQKQTLDLAQNGNAVGSGGAFRSKDGAERRKNETAFSDASSQLPAPAPTLLDARKLIRNALVELEVASFDTALDKLGTAATSAGGYIATKNSARGGNGKLRGTIIIKVLPQNLDSFLLDLRSLGEVKNQTLATQDVTKEYTDTAARLRNAERMEERLLKMLDEAKGKISEILQVEKELGRVRENIEQMTGELKLYDSLVSYATVTLTLSERDLDQPAVYLLRENGNLDLLAADVEKTYAETRRIADSAQAQIQNAQVQRDSNGRVSVTLSLLIPAPAAERTLEQLKALGRIASFHSQTERTAQNGSDADAGALNAKVENAPASFQISIRHDEQTHRRIAFNVFAKDLDPAFDSAKKAAAEAGAEVVSSDLTRPRAGAGRATLVLRVPGPKHAELVAVLQKLGRASDYQVQRDAADSDTSEAPVLISLQLTDEEPSVQQTRLGLEANDIEKRAQNFKKDALAAGATVRDSSFTREPDGRETAQLVLRIPLEKYPDLLARAQALGKTQELSVQRREIASSQPADSSAPAELSLTLSSEKQIVASNTGLLATLRHTLGQAIASLLWSLQMIGVALAFLAPWVAAAAIAWLILRRLRRKK